MHREIIVPEAVVVESESICSGIVLVHSTHPSCNPVLYAVCESEKQLESAEAFGLCCYMQTSAILQLHWVQCRAQW